MTRARSIPSRPETVAAAARPEAVLVLAGAVPLSAAVLLAAGLVPSGARIVLGAAVVAIGLQVLAQDGTAIGARLGRHVARGLGLAIVAVGGLLAIGALVAVVAGGRLDTPEGWFGVRLDGAEAALLGVLTVGSGAGVGLLGRAPRPADTAPGTGGGPRTPEGAGPAPRGALAGTAAVLVAAGVAVAVLGVLGTGVLGLDGGAWRTVVTALAVVGAVAALRGPGELPGRAAGVAAGLLLAVAWGEASGTVGAVAGTLLPVGPGATPEGLAAALLVLAGGTATGLLVLALRRGDPLLGAPAVAVLLDARFVEPGVGQPAALLVPVLVVVAGLAGVVGRGPVARRFAPAAVAAAVVVGLVAYYGAVQQTPDGTLYSPTSDVDRTDGGLVRFAVVALVLLVAGAAVVRRSPVEVRAAPAVVVVLGIAAVQPFLLLSQAARGTVLGDSGGIAGLGVLSILAAVLVARARPVPVVLAATGLSVAVAATGVGYGIAFSASPDDATLLALATYGPVLALLVATAASAIFGPPRRVPAAQSLAGGLTLGLAVAVVATAGLLAGGLVGDDAPADGILDGAGAVVAVGLLLALTAGVALLAASTSRRPSGPVGSVAVLACATVALTTAAVAAAIAGGSTDGDQGAGAQVLDLGLGFDAAAGALGLAPGAWPVLLAVLGATLVGAGAWLASRTPPPADAPVR